MHTIFSNNTTSLNTKLKIRNHILHTSIFIEQRTASRYQGILFHYALFQNYKPLVYKDVHTYLHIKIYNDKPL